MSKRGTYSSFRTQQRVTYIAIVLLVIFFIGIVYTAFYSISKEIKAVCYDSLRDATVQEAGEIKKQFNVDTYNLQTTANVIKPYAGTDNAAAAEIMKNIDKSGLMTSVALLLPGDKLLKPDGSVIDASGVLSFEDLKKRGAYISSKNTMIEDKTQSVVRNFIPVKRSGETVAILTGIISLEQMRESFKVNAFNGKANVLIIENNSRKMLMNTSNKEKYQNLSELLKKRKEKGYNVAQEEGNTEKGRSGNVEFVSESTGDTLYMHYQPVGVNDWVIYVTVSEGVGFGRLKTIRYHMVEMIMGLVVLFAAFIISIYSSLTKSLNMYKQQCTCLGYISKVESLLFNAHRHPRNTEKALKEVANVTKAPTAYLIVFDGDVVSRFCCWNNGNMPGFDLTGKNMKAVAPEWYKDTVESSGVIFLCDSNLPSREAGSETIFDRLKPYGVTSIRQMTVRTSDNDAIGVIGVCNSKLDEDGDIMLENVALSFAAEIRNDIAHRKIVEMGTIDYTTGLQNRNSYLELLKKIKPETFGSAACVYIDVNGLHEFNNAEGHDAGDSLLYTLGHAILDSFSGWENYRMGGDEFLAIGLDMDETNIKECIDKLYTEMKSYKFSFSIGVELRKGKDLDISDMVKASDKKMYEDKMEYYRTHERRKI
ncbi:MAG: GGDEF domain-containing protein [Bacillota bacterium]|nr:GGDEF domain-containing protein [Bacillota bacterium]